MTQMMIMMMRTNYADDNDLTKEDTGHTEDKRTRGSDYTGHAEDERRQRRQEEQMTRGPVFMICYFLFL